MSKVILAYRGSLRPASGIGDPEKEGGREGKEERSRETKRLVLKIQNQALLRNL